MVVGMATVYGLDGPGIESRWGARFSAPIKTDPVAYTGSLSPGGKPPGRTVDNPHPSIGDVKGRIEL
jgi:hypothetical protein